MTDTFFDKPIDGDITHYTEGLAEQHDPKEFMDALDALINLNGVQAVRWSQSTPYFNDGDACVFGVNGFEVRLEVDAELDEPDPDEYDFDNQTWRGEWELYRIDPDITGLLSYQERKSYLVNGFDTTEIYNAIEKMDNLAQHHEIVLSEKFGDPAQVVYDGESFKVEYYDHD